MVKFEFLDNLYEPLFIRSNNPKENDLIQIHFENGETTEYIVESVTYHLQDVNGILFGSGDSTICVKLKPLENF